MITNKNILDFEKRAFIYQFILKNPGLHVREIERKSKIPKSTLVHHLKFLEKRELVKTFQTKRHTRYYANGKIGKREKKIINILRQEIPFKIVLSLLTLSLITSRRELSSELERHPNTISFHLNKLEQAGIIEKCPKSNGMAARHSNGKFVLIGKSNKNQKIYRLVNPWEVYNVLIVNKENLLAKHKETDRLILWNIVHHNNKINLPDITNDFDSSLNSTIRKLKEVFPHPYHV